MQWGLNNLFNKKDADIFLSNYTPKLTNVNSLEDAQIIVLPEWHHNSEDLERNAWIINKLYKEGDIVLVESPLNSIDQTFHQVELVSRKITVHGWDCAESDEAMHKAKQPKYDLIEKSKHLNYNGKEFEQLLRNAIENSPVEEKERTKLYKLLETLLKAPNNTSDMGLGITRPIATDILIQRIFPDSKGEIYEAHCRTFPIRQQKLIERCKEFSKEPSRRIFVITGGAHALIDVDTPGKEIYEEGVKAFHDYLQTTKFVIFDHLRKPTKDLSSDVRTSSRFFKFKNTLNKICSYIAKPFLMLMGALLLGLSTFYVFKKYPDIYAFGFSVK